MKYNKKLIQALLDGTNAHAATAHVVNGVYYSYDTPIAVYPVLGMKHAIVDCTRYSQTTSRQRNELIQALKDKGVTVQETYAKIEV